MYTYYNIIISYDIDIVHYFCIFPSVQKRYSEC